MFDPEVILAQIRVLAVLSLLVSAAALLEPRKGSDYFASLSSVHTHKLVWAPWSWFQIFSNQEPVDSQNRRRRGTAGSVGAGYCVTMEGLSRNA